MDPEDPNVIAENELLGAAASIEAAARKLAELRPRQRPKVFIITYPTSTLVDFYWIFFTYVQN